LERETILRGWNDTAHPIPHATLPELFARAAAKHPDAVAVAFADETLSYRELDSRANRLAHHLRAYGVGPETVVGVCLARSLNLIVGLLAILKAGGAYLPLDPDYPQERLAFMLADARVRVLLTHAATHNVTQAVVALVTQASDAAPIVVDVDADAVAIASQRPTAPVLAVDPQHTAYVTYTSGSTGIPKVWWSPIAEIPNLAAAQIERFGMDAQARVLQFASLSFDAAVSEIATTLLCGATLVLSAAERSDVRAWRSCCASRASRM
jgi:non-ribosomal peptide synthetase component F